MHLAAGFQSGLSGLRLNDPSGSSRKGYFDSLASNLPPLDFVFNPKGSGCGKILWSLGSRGCELPTFANFYLGLASRLPDRIDLVRIVAPLLFCQGSGSFFRIPRRYFVDSRTRSSRDSVYNLYALYPL